MSTAKKIPRICEWSETRPLTGIAALARNRVIGRNGKLPWRLPEDFKHFKATTMGGALIMGRVSYEEIGRPLPGRETIVLSGTATEIPGVSIVRNWAEIEALFPEKKLFLAGGAQLYEQGLLMCNELILTHVNLEPDGDAFFPPYRDYFDDGEVLSETAEFTIRRHRRLHR
jgi:dihydrofolate reductase